MANNYQKGLVGVFGDPVDDNPSVVIEQAAFDALGIPMQYLTIQVKKGDLKNAVAGMRAMNFDGINLTMPHKIEILQYLDEVAEDARIMGAVNTVYVRDGRLCGANTDGKGFIMNLKNGNIEIQGKHAVVLGAGGAARAITVELANEGAKKITIVNRGKERGEELAKLLRENTKAEVEFTVWEGAYPVPADADILVNSTSIGFIDAENKPEIDYDTLKDTMAVCDVIPNSSSTPFLREAQKRGCTTFHGLQMLVNQGAIAFELWTGKEAPVDVMLNALKKEYGDET